MFELISFYGFFQVVLRAAILCFQSLVIGGILFLLLAARREELRPEEILRPAWKLIRWSALGVVLSQACFGVANSMVLAYSAALPFKEILGANYVLAAFLAVSGGLAIEFWPAGMRKSMSAWVLLPAGMVLAASVITSHATSRMENRALLASLTALHYLTTASWIGGLAYLLLTMKCVPDGMVKMQIVRNFSRMALVSVALLFAAGLGMSWVYVGSWDALYGTGYGVMVTTKVILFGCLLLLGAGNFLIVRQRGSGKETGMASLSRFVEAEIGIGLSVILAAASLTSQPPAVDLTQDRVSLPEIATRYAPRMPRLSSPNVKDLSESTMLMFKRAKAEGETLPPAFMPGQFAADTTKLADMAWSEYNHNWAGLIVFFMGTLALLSRSRYFSWAKVWPLMFLGLAIFLFLRADPENWPLGPNGFWRSFSVPEVLQHRAVVLLITAFAIFTWGVETHRIKSMAAALVFPGVCILGGMVLLTHSHSLGNIKEELLVELSHTSLAILAIIAGWSRWLELRLPPGSKAPKYLSWLWPVCFILVGLILMDYHEY
jgi:putative copper resistance protein D